MMDRSEAVEIASQCAPFIRDLAERHENVVASFLKGEADAHFSDIISNIKTIEAESDADIMRVLREAKREVALLIALADIAREWPTLKVTEALSTFAQVSLTAACNHILRSAADRGILTLEDESDPSKGSGWIVLGMGKFGAEELNYSSDIDLIVFFDPQVARVEDKLEIKKHFVRMTQQLAKLMQDRTEHGYVFRTDLRLRPDPGSTTVAISTDAAFHYYETMGQNWERAAFIKARPVAGDIEAGESFLKGLSPFVWRKYMDFATIADVQSMKRQIHRFKGHGEIAILGHDVKLGRGGIREIEFFTQTQQLIAGGRNPALRGLKTLQMLNGLEEAGWLEQVVADELAEHYCFLRNVEHRIQMRHDEQTHKLPESEEGLADVAALMGQPLDVFQEQLKTVMQRVAHHYDALFAEAGNLTVSEGSLVFTGDDDDPETLETISRLGFSQASQIIGIIRGWHYGRIPATRSEKARALLTEITPDILRGFGESSAPDQAFFAFDQFLKKLPAGIQFFALLRSNPRLIELMAMITGNAPRLADIIARRPHVFDTLIDPGFFNRLPSWEEQAELISTFIEEARGYEDVLDRLRIFGQEQQFLIGIRLLTGASTPNVVGKLYSDLADVLVAEALNASWQDMITDHGSIAGMDVAIIAMGKHGGRELTAGSDLDLILIYDFDAECSQSDGAKPIEPQRYFARLTQRFIGALSAPTAEGVLYELDMRLRPSGNKGPVAVRFEAFERYQKNDAWTWEHMALTRGRVVTANDGLKSEIQRVIGETLQAERDQDKLKQDVTEMNIRLHEAKKATSIWQVKEHEGGLVDIEFLAQYWALLTRGEIDARDTQKALKAAFEKGLLGPENYELLAEALALYTNIIHMLRLCVSNSFNAEEASPAFKAQLASICNEPDFAHLEARLQDFQHRVRQIACDVLGISETLEEKHQDETPSSLRV